LRKSAPCPGSRFLPAPSAVPGGLFCRCKLHYNPMVRSFSSSSHRLAFALAFFLLSGALSTGQQAPAPSGARILLMPRKLVTGEHATLAVLDVSGRLTPGVKIVFSDAETVTTDATGRALFVAPLNPGTIYASIEGRVGRVSSTVLTAVDVPSATESVLSAPRVASISDRFEFMGHGFCGDADANHVSISGLPGLVLASSPASLVVLPPTDMDPGPAQVTVTCGQKSAEPFTVVFVSMELEASSAPLPPGEHRTLLVRVRGSTAKINLEARNLSAEVAELTGGGTVRATSSGGEDNVAKFELVGKKRGNFIVSIRLVSPLSSPR
jgi:hypothetical protein